MKLFNIEYMENQPVDEYIGLVQGSSVVTTSIKKDFFVGFKALNGGELEEYRLVLDKAREKAVERMISEAEAVGANAIINVRFNTSSILSGAAEIIATGTAVVIRNLEA